MEGTTGPASYHDHAVVRIDLKHLDDAEATTLLHNIEVGYDTVTFTLL